MGGRMVLGPLRGPAGASSLAMGLSITLSEAHGVLESRSLYLTITEPSSQ